MIKEMKVYEAECDQCHHKLIHYSTSTMFPPGWTVQEVLKEYYRGIEQTVRKYYCEKCSEDHREMGPVS